VQHLLERGAEITCPENEYGEVGSEIPLHAAAEGGHYEIAKMLIEHGSPISPSPYGEEATPLFYAAVEGHLSIARLLLRHGASVWESEFDVAMVKLFLKYGADPDMPGSFYETPLYHTARTGAVKTMKVLLEAGANIDGKMIMVFAHRHASVKVFTLEM
jgi:ankyrin repeat protein